MADVTHKVCTGTLCRGDLVSLSGFNRDRTRPDGLCRQCKKCLNHNARTRYNENREFLLGDQVCWWPGCESKETLEFCHRDPRTKKYDVTNYMHCSREFLQPEVDKCDIYCHKHHMEYDDLMGHRRYRRSTEEAPPITVIPSPQLGFSF